MADSVITLRINADGKVAVQVMQQIASAEAEIGRAAKASANVAGTAARGMEQGFRRAGDAVAGMSSSARQMTQQFTLAGQAAVNLDTQINSVRHSVTGFLGALASAHFVREFVAGMIDANTQLQSWQYGLQAATGSTQKAQAALAFVRAESERLGISLADSATTFTRLAAAVKGTALEGEAAQGIFTGVAEAARTLHLSGAETQQALTALDQMMSKGTVQAQELKLQLGNVLPGAFHVAADAMGVTTQELNKLMESGQLVAEDFLPKFAARLHELYGITASDAANSPAAALERAKNAWFEFKAELADAGFMDAAATVAEKLAVALKLLADHAQLLTGGVFAVLATQATRVAKSFIAWRMEAGIAAIQAGELADAELFAARAAEAEALAELNKARARATSTLVTTEATAAEAAYATAQVRTAEAAKAASLAQVTGAAKLGKGLLALAGGWVGVGIAAIAGLVYAIRQAIAHEREMRQEIEDTAQRLTQQARAADDLTESLRNINAVHFEPLPDFAQTFDKWAAGAKEAAEQTARLATARTGLAEVEARLESMRGATGPLATSFGDLERQAAKYRLEIEKLSGPADQLTQSSHALGQALEDTLSPSLREAAAAAHSMFDAFGAGDAITRMTGALQQAGIKMGLLKDNAAEWNKAAGDLSQSITGVNSKFETFGKTEAQVIKGKLEAVQATEVWKKMTQAQRDAMTESAQAAIEHAQAMEKQKKPTDDAKDAARDLANALRDQANAHQSAADKVFELQQKIAGASDEEIRFGQAVRATNVEMLATIAAGGNATEAVQRYLDTVSLLQQAQNLTPQASGLAALQQMLAGATDELADLKAQLGGASQAQVAFNKTQRDAVAEMNKAGGAANAAAKAQYDATMAKAAAVRDAAEQLQDATNLDDMLNQYEQASPFQRLADDVDTFKAALDGAFGPQSQEMVGRLTKAIDEANYQIAVNMVSGTAQALRGLQSLTKQGSKDYAALGVAADAMTAVEAVLAVVHQATAGDVYTAIPRMIAMAGTLASLGQSVSIAGGSGFSDTAAQRQATQGTGTVLGDATAQSASIANAVEITAKASEKLVAINTGMLNALRGLQAAIGGASGMLARGAGQVDFSGQNLAVGRNAIGALLQDSNKAIGLPDLLGIFKARSKITDQGIKILGGTISDLINGDLVKAYQEVQSKSWLFGSTHTKEGTAAVSDAFATQFQLILQSIADTVREGALALGVLPADIEDAIRQYQIAATNISLKDLSAEDQQKALEAVFSSIFDGLAGAVVPYVEQFQQVGEGLGETLVRVATEVQVMQEATRQLGLVDTADPEQFAQIADELVNLVGGIEAFATAMTGFVDTFAPEAYKLQLAGDTLALALDQAGLAVPDTRDAMWALMQSLDATTASGREQIATLLRLADTADQYYSLVEKHQKELLQAQEDYAATIADLQGELGKNPLAKSLLEIGKWSRDTTQRLRDLAAAAGMAGAKESDLALVREVAMKRMQAAIDALMEQSRSIADQLGYTSSVADTATSAVSGFGDAMSTAADKATDAINLLIGNQSPYKDRAKLQFALQGQLAGTVTPQQVLEIAQRMYASTWQYKEIFDRVMAIGDRTQRSADASGQYGASAASEATQKALSQADRYQLADQLANNIADLAYAQQISFNDVADKLGLNLSDLAKDLGLGNQALDDYLSVLAADNFGLDDLHGVLASEVDRLIEAITGTTPSDAFEAGGHAELGGPIVYDRAVGPAGNTLDDVVARLEKIENSLGGKLDALGTMQGNLLERTAEAAERTAEAAGETTVLTREGLDARPVVPRGRPVAPLAY